VKLTAYYTPYRSAPAILIGWKIGKVHSSGEHFFDLDNLAALLDKTKTDQYSLNGHLAAG
jgi:hypothetical protein